MAATPPTLVLVANLGTPAAATPAAVAEFLREFLSDPLVVDYPAILWHPLLERVILRSRPARVAEMYRSVAGEGPLPLAAGTREIAAALGRSLGGDFEVEPAYRYGSPSVVQRVSEALQTGLRDVVVAPLFSQRTSSSSETIVLAVEATARTHAAGGRVRIARVAPDDGDYVEAIADRVRGAEPFEHLVVSFHGIPKRYERREGGRYSADCRATTRALVERLGLEKGKVSLAFQSRFGPEPWLGPATFDVLRGLAKRGLRQVAVVMPGFVTEGLETLEEIGVRGREAFLEAGGERLVAVPAVGAHPAFIAALTRSVTREAESTTQKRAI